MKKRRWARRMERSEAGEKASSIAPQDARASSRKSLLPVREKGPAARPSRRGVEIRSVRAGEPPPAGRARRSAMNRSNSSRSLARRIASDIFGELALRLVELAALFVEPRQLGRPPFVESGVAGRSAIEAARAVHRAAAPRRPQEELPDIMVRASCHLLVASVCRSGPPYPALPELVAEDRKTDRPEDDEAKNHRDDFERASSANRRAANGRPPTRSRQIPARRTNHPSHYPQCPLRASMSSRQRRSKRAIAGARMRLGAAKRRARAFGCKKALH